MTEPELAALTTPELLEKQKQAKSHNILHAVLIGMVIGIAVYSTARNGLGLLSFLPLLLIPFVKNNQQNKERLKKELQARNLE